MPQFSRTRRNEKPYIIRPVLRNPNREMVVHALRLLTGLAIALLMISFPTMAASQGINGFKSDTSGCSNPMTLPGSGSLGDNTAWNCTMDALLLNGHPAPRHGWGPDTFFVTGPATITVNITDCCRVGDFFTLYATTDSSLVSGWFKVGITPQVHSGPELVAPTYDSLWDGTGTTYSSKTFAIAVPAGVTYFFRVNNALFHLMGNLLVGPCSTTTHHLLRHGCSVPGIDVSHKWSPSGYQITFS
jgi:hypothetical protein